MKLIERTEAVTGDPAKRTPRHEIVEVFGEDVLKELKMAADCSESEKWGPPDRSFPVWPVQLQAMEVLVAAVEHVDSQMEAEQAAHAGQDDNDDPDADEGGVMSAFFNDTYVPVGDLNSKNLHRKIAALRDPRNNKPVPCGGTVVGGAVRYLDERHLKEFWKNKETGLVVPVASRPWGANVLFTDGAMTDYKEFVYRLEMDKKRCQYLAEFEQQYQGLWPGEHWFAAILGEGDDHDNTVTLYKSIARDFPNLHLMAFTGVRSGPEVGEDVAYAILNTK
jgi:hypothetical protein